MRNIAIVDLDDVIFNTVQFKTAYNDKLVNFGVPDFLVKNTYLSAKNKGWYDADLHTRLMASVSKMKLPELTLGVSFHSNNFIVCPTSASP